MIEEVHGFDPNSAKLESFDLLKPNTMYPSLAA
jgi:hypothetical protein